MSSICLSVICHTCLCSLPHTHTHTHAYMYMYYTTCMHKYTMHKRVHTAIHVIQASTQVLYMYVLTHTCTCAYAYRQDIHTTRSCSVFHTYAPHCRPCVYTLFFKKYNGSLGLCIAHGIQQRSLPLCTSRVSLPWLAR